MTFDYIVNKMVPLTRTEPDGTWTDVLCWRIDGVLHVRPERLDLFVRLMSEAGLLGVRLTKQPENIRPLALVPIRFDVPGEQEAFKIECRYTFAGLIGV
jgi:hypothetical protein